MAQTVLLQHLPLFGKVTFIEKPRSSLKDTKQIKVNIETKAVFKVNKYSNCKG